ncbi:MAG: hypothetical protein ACFCD0_30480 [Gemmataceae bacterium]
MYAGVNTSSFRAASEKLRRLADIDVGPKQVQRVTKRIGSERIAERDQQVQDYQQLPLVERKAAPADVTAPQVAVVGVDGGRIQSFERKGQPVACEDQPTWENDNNATHWREDKIGLLMSLESLVHETDPCPEIPTNFLDPFRIAELAGELNHKPPMAAQESDSNPPADSANEPTVLRDIYRQPPEVIKNRIVGPLWLTGPKPTGRSGGSIFRLSLRSWISFMLSLMCLKRPPLAEVRA